MTVSSNDLSSFFNRYRELELPELPELSAETLRDFFVALNTLRHEQDIDLAKMLADRIPEFRRGMDAAKALARETELRDAPGFNVFRVLRVSHKEVAHSDFLAEILDPGGSHGQGARFLLSFLELVKEYGGLPRLELTKLHHGLEDATVNREAAIVAGRCDLVIALPGDFLLVIENKVHAKEGDEQLPRYARWLSRQKHLYPSRSLVLLTPKGEYSQALDVSTHTPLSYRPAIENWLRSCLETCRPYHLQAVLGEYIADLPRAKGE